MINEYGFSNYGWTCPKCGRVYSPTHPVCLYCNDKRVIFAASNPPTETGIYDNEWFKTPLEYTSWRDWLDMQCNKWED